MLVNFYTLTFKQKIFISFVLIFTSLASINIALYIFMEMKSTKTTFMNYQFSKKKHFIMNNPQNKDIIFIGSSRTFFHIGTNTFKKNGINIYNFGLVANGLEAYPNIIPFVNKFKPKQVVVSLSVNTLYNKLNIPQEPTLEELKYFYEIDKVKFLQVIKQWFISKHLFMKYSTPIYSRIQSFYNKFIPQVTSNLAERDNIKLSFVKKKSLINQSANYSKMAKCNVFDVKQSGDYKIILKCSNGDGALIGNNIKKQTNNLQNLTILNQESIKYIHKLISSANTKIQVVLILEPIFHNTYQYNIDYIKKEFNNIKVIDLTNMKIKDSLWSDDAHLDYKGKAYYSQYLADLLSNNSHSK